MFELSPAETTPSTSYRNTIVRQARRRQSAGVLISYDGAMLAPLRRAFIEEYCRHFGTDMDEASIHDETDASEIYLDTLAVIPECRGKGIASALIAEASRRAQSAGKPLGLLVDKHNSKARLLYEKSGFKPVGERFFLNELMDHMQM